MGISCSCKNNYSLSQNNYNKEMNKFNFKKLYLIGRGGFSRVWKVKCKNTNKVYALKEMLKVKLFQKHSIESILQEKDFLTTLRNPFLVNLIYAFQDTDNIYFIMEYLSGGDLRYYFSMQMKFNYTQLKFIVSNVLIALKYLHSNSIIHRDIKPENLIFDSKGYVHLADLGIAKKIKNNQIITCSSGTPSYMPPESLMKKPQGFPVDFFSLGVVIYEIIFNRVPYRGKSRQEIIDKMLAKQVYVKEKSLPKDFNDNNLSDFINKLIQRKREERLGVNGIEEVIAHPYLKDVDWGKIEKMRFDNIPFIPIKKDNFIYENVNLKDDFQYENYKECLDRINRKSCFRTFYYNFFEESEKIAKTSRKSFDYFATSQMQWNSIENKTIIKEDEIDLEDDEDNAIIAKHHLNCKRGLSLK